ncbi:hypothetical protein LNP59_19265 [Klebsiella pneumoniae subsp. pneumoniae]|nr:hypothetical protein [Klebsiella pneumoniae subsp. pneumoniae]
MIVIYTREELKTVWMQIASSLRGIENCNDKILETENDELIEYWQSVILPDLIHKGERALTRDETVLYIQTDCLCKRIKKAIRDDGSLTEQNDINFIAKMISEYAVAENAVIPDYVTKKYGCRGIQPVLNGFKVVIYLSVCSIRIKMIMKVMVREFGKH